MFHIIFFFNQNENYIKEYKGLRGREVLIRGTHKLLDEKCQLVQGFFLLLGKVQGYSQVRITLESFLGLPNFSDGKDF